MASLQDILQGALAGAGAGAALGPWGALGGAVLGGFGGGFLSSPAQTEQINPYTADIMSMLQGNMDNFNTGLYGSFANQDRMLGQSGSYFNQLANFQPQASFDPGAQFRALQGQVPQLQRIVDSSLGGQSNLEDIAQRRANQAAQQAMQQFASMGGAASGAAQTAASRGAGEAAQSILGSFDQQRNAMLGNLIGQQSQNLQQGFLADYQGQQNRDSLLMQALAQAASGYAGLGNQYGGRANVFGSLLGGTQGILGQYGAPELVYTPPVSGADIFGPYAEQGVAGYLGYEDRKRQQEIDDALLEFMKKFS